MKHRRAHQLYRRDEDVLNCGSGGGDTGDLHLRILSIFVILVGSMCGALFPVLARRTKFLRHHIHKAVFDFAKYFGSGVIVCPTSPAPPRILLTILQIATAFIHLLDPAIEELGSPCLPPGWSEYVRPSCSSRAIHAANTLPSPSTFTLYSLPPPLKPGELLSPP